MTLSLLISKRKYMFEKLFQLYLQFFLLCVVIFIQLIVSGLIEKLKVGLDEELDFLIVSL